MSMRQTVQLPRSAGDWLSFSAGALVGVACVVGGAMLWEHVSHGSQGVAIRSHGIAETVANIQELDRLAFAPQAGLERGGRAVPETTGSIPRFDGAGEPRVVQPGQRDPSGNVQTMPEVAAIDEHPDKLPSSGQVSPKQEDAPDVSGSTGSHAPARSADQQGRDYDARRVARFARLSESPLAPAPHENAQTAAREVGDLADAQGEERTPTPEPAMTLSPPPQADRASEEVGSGDRRDTGKRLAAVDPSTPPQSRSPDQPGRPRDEPSGTGAEAHPEFKVRPAPDLPALPSRRPAVPASQRSATSKLALQSNSNPSRRPPSRKQAAAKPPQNMTPAWMVRALGLTSPLYDRPARKPRPTNGEQRARRGNWAEDALNLNGRLLGGPQPDVAIVGPWSPEVSIAGIALSDSVADTAFPLGGNSITTTAALDLWRTQLHISGSGSSAALVDFAAADSWQPHITFADPSDGTVIVRSQPAGFPFQQR